MPFFAQAAVLAGCRLSRSAQSPWPACKRLIKKESSSAAK